jgi:TRAP-type C4-dicarboxylate transport system permease small subunit
MADGLQERRTAAIGNSAWLHGVVRLCEAVTTLALIAMVSVIVLDIVTRNLFGFSFQVSDELSGYFLVTATFLAMPVALAQGGLHKVGFLEDRLSARGRLRLQIGVAFVSLAACLTIEWSLARFVVLSYQSGDTAMTDLGTPLWIPQAAMPIGFGLFCLMLAATIAAKIAQLRLPSAAAPRMTSTEI